MCSNLGEFDEEFYNNTSWMGLLTRMYRLGCIQSLRSFSDPSNLASGGFLTALPLTGLPLVAQW